MARVLMLIVVINIVTAYDEEIRNCNQCIRTGGRWCKQIGSEDHCLLNPSDAWCPDNEEILPKIIKSSTPGKTVNSLFINSQLFVGIRTLQDITYESHEKLDVKLSILNSTQRSSSRMNESIEIYEDEWHCKGPKCTSTIAAAPTTRFCSENDGAHEYVFVKVTIGNLTEEPIIKYLISCACLCSDVVQKNSEICHGNGDLSCGVCSCHNGWSGDFCENSECATKGGCPTHKTVTQKPPAKGCQIEPNSAKCNGNGDFECGKCHCHRGWSGEFCQETLCEDKRGDVQCNNPARNDVECSGNGYCGPCDTCICYTDREGSQYFDEDNYCSDLCIATSFCDACLINNTLGECTDCNPYINKLKYNESLTDRRDYYNRKIWMRCNETIEDCTVTYYAMRDETGRIDIMIVDHCDNYVADEVKSTKVPIIMGVLGLIAAVMAVAGIVAWKHFNTVPSPSLSKPEYQNIDAEGCTGENPLYKSPLTSIKNPMFGKW